MSKALSPKQRSTSIPMSARNGTSPPIILKGNPNKMIKNASSRPKSSSDENMSTGSANTMLEFEDLTSNSSIMEFLKQEEKCYENGESMGGAISSESDMDAEKIFQEVSRLADNSDTRSVDELLREAEILLKCSHLMESVKKSPVKKLSNNGVQLNAKFTKSIENRMPEKYKVKCKKGQGDAVSPKESKMSSPEVGTPTPILTNGHSFDNFMDNVITESVLSQESAPQGLNYNNTNTSTNNTSKDVNTKQQLNSDDTDGGTDTIEEIAEAMETIELEIVHDDCEEQEAVNLSNNTTFNNTMTSAFSAMSSCASDRPTVVQQSKQSHHHYLPNNQNMPNYNMGRRSSGGDDNAMATFYTPPQVRDSISNLLGSPLRRLTPIERRSSNYLMRRSSMTTPDSGISSQINIPTTSTPSLSSSPLHKSVAVGTPFRTYCNKSVNCSPQHMVSTHTSPLETHSSMMSITREYTLKQEIEKLQERLKDTEERLESFRLQHDTLSQLHRKLRESNTTLQEQCDVLKLDVQHLNECASVLRNELQSARHDRDEAVELQKMLQNELEETRAEKKRAQELKEKDGKVIQDLQRQCREMERILMRKHPDSVSALIVASKNSNMSCGGGDQESLSSRKLLEQRIAQLEADAKEQDFKAQKILANVQARFNSVQAKYETHIADLETQVLSLQEINTKLNEKIESQVRTLDYFVSKKTEHYYNNCTQTDEYPFAPVMLSPANPKPIQPKTNNNNNQNNKTNRKTIHKTVGIQTLNCTRECSTNTIGTSSQQSANSSASSTANSTPNNSRPNSKQSGLRKPQVTATTLTASSISSKFPAPQSDSSNSTTVLPSRTTNSVSAAATTTTIKEDAHLVATIRGMRIDLAIKNKALQRLTRELDECRKTIKKLQKERDVFKHHSTASLSSKSQTSDRMPASTDMQVLKEAQSRYKLLEADYKILHEKRLQDLKTLQTAHERELASCHETVRILQQRLSERDEQNSMQKRRKLPVDYYALKAKVTSLERRHSEREERLHMLVEALSKGRLNSALEDLLGDNNNQ